MPGNWAASLIALFLLSWGILFGGDTLPSVLILGVQVYQQPANELKKELRGKVEIHFPRHEPGFVWNSSTASQVLNQYLGDKQWDLIYFNCGLGDLIHRVPEIKSHRIMPRHAGGVRTTDPKNYESNLNLLVKKLSVANSVGTADGSASDIVSSLLNSVILTPCLNPSPSRLLIAIEAAKVTVPVPWSTLKNLPILKNPSWSVEAKNTLPLPRSLTSLACVAGLTGSP